MRFGLVRVNHRSIAPTHRTDPEWLLVNTVIGEYGVRTGDFKRRGVVSSNRHGRSGRNVLVQPGFFGELHHVVVPHHFGNFDCGHVHRMGHGLPERHLPEVFVFKIAGFIGLVIEPECSRFIHYCRGRRKNPRSAVHRRIESGRIDKWLERRAWLS